ncbi:nucleotidyltransferase domain-containing protein [Paenibacillus sp. YN15]|uniref:nucleotidyltransferase domain-containing protein n=1 Tax=Paenibacillus sp. YN15 TaxID=1742774 RepID=UPI000DCBA19C|nr:nucleotidyltransferase domain-containing protein [Paenibacillus sp. YN15]RAV05619.1 hypothetical protein DQG13_03105 [Paenibacillus sp. YN15]
MFLSHQENIRQYTAEASRNSGVLAVIIGGSIAHGYATEKSDIDVMLVVPEEEFERRLEAGEIQFLDKAFHVDGKYISLEFIRKVIASGNEATRYSFEGAFVTFSRVEGLEELLAQAQAYPLEQKQDKINRFYGQFKAWHWYCKDALKKGNPYLLDYAVSNLVLFGGRLILAYNEKLFPYQKWFLRVLDSCGEKPDQLMEKLDALMEKKGLAEVEAFHSAVDEFSQWNTTGRRWPNLFLYDSEWKWLYGEPPVADL